MINADSNKFFEYWRIRFRLVQRPMVDIMVNVEPAQIVPFESEIRLNCQLFQSTTIYWSSGRNRERMKNPLRIYLSSSDVEKRLICHAKSNTGQWRRKIVSIQRHSSGKFIISVSHSALTTKSTLNSSIGKSII